MQSYLCGTSTDAQKRCDLDVREVLDVIEHEYVAKWLGERCERRFEREAFEHWFLRSDLATQRRECNVRTPPPLATSPVHERGAYGHLPEPGGEGTVLLVVPKRKWKAHEHVLDYILGLVHRLQEADRKAQQWRRKPRVQEAERIIVAAFETGGQLSIARLFHVGFTGQHQQAGAEVTSVMPVVRQILLLMRIW